MKCLAALLFLSLTVLARADVNDKPPGDEGSPWLTIEEQSKIVKLWPHGVEFPNGIKFYRATEWTQYMAHISPFRGIGKHEVLPWRADKDYPIYDDRGRFAPIKNPNQQFPYRVSGGMHDIPQSEWVSYKGAKIPLKIKTWRGKVAVRNAPGGWLPKQLYEFPAGSVFVDMLATKAGVFELRQRIKRGDGWESLVLFRDPDNAPAGYKGLTKRCAECHDNPEPSVYHLNLRRQDGCFSFSPLIEGTLTPNKSLTQ